MNEVSFDYIIEHCETVGDLIKLNNQIQEDGEQ